MRDGRDKMNGEKAPGQAGGRHWLHKGGDLQKGQARRRGGRGPAGYPSVEAHEAAGNCNRKCRKGIQATDSSLEAVSIQTINKAAAMGELTQGEHGSQGERPRAEC